LKSITYLETRQRHLSWLLNGCRLAGPKTQTTILCKPHQSFLDRHFW